MQGEIGPLDFTRTTVALGVQPPQPKPCRDEYHNLAPTTSRKLVVDAQAFLARHGVQKMCELGNDPALLFLGEPRLVNRGKRIVVSRVLNHEIPGWGYAPAGADGEDKGDFTDTSTAEGYYSCPSRDPLMRPNQYFVHSEEGGRDFYDYITAAAINGGIIFNAHSPDFSHSPYHEILHTFEGNNLSSSKVLKEGIVEAFSRQFCAAVYGIMFPIYPAYTMDVVEAEKLIRATSLRDVAMAYFGDDVAALEKLVPLFYEATAATLPHHEQLSGMTRIEAAKLNKVRDFTGQFAMKKQGSWYRKWVTAHGGKVPLGGVVV